MVHVQLNLAGLEFRLAHLVFVLYDLFHISHLYLGFFFL